MFSVSAQGVERILNVRYYYYYYYYYNLLLPPVRRIPDELGKSGGKIVKQCWSRLLQLTHYGLTLTTV